MADGDHVLIADVPHGLGLADRIKIMNVGSGKSGRMRSDKGLNLDVGGLRYREFVSAFADVDRHLTYAA